jgi:predicted alpha/beta hydrolase family esterase
MKKTIYYLPGHGGQLGTGLGQALLERGFDVAGRATVGEFRQLPFSEQVNAVAHDLRTNFWQDNAQVVANSFGAYLFLHAQSQLEPYIGKVLLLSPIVGDFSDEASMMSFSPPRAGKLLELAKSRAYPSPKHCEIHVGEDDWQSNPNNVTTLASLFGLKVTVVPGAGHMLGKAYVGSVLDMWLTVQ